MYYLQREGHGQRRARCVIRLPVEKGGRLDTKNKAERTPLDTATRARQPNEKTISLLKELAAR